MVQIIESRPDFMPISDVVALRVRRASEDSSEPLAEWTCAAHAGRIVDGRFGRSGEVKQASKAFLDAVAYARQNQIRYMLIDDPEGLFPPEKRFSA